MSAVERTISFKPNFLKELGKLPSNHQAQVMAKVGMLATDPDPDAKTRKRLKGVEDGLCRLRSGDYRVFYAYDDRAVSLYSVRLRSDDTYDAMPDATPLDHGTFTPPESAGPTEEDFRRWITRDRETTALPEPVTEDLLSALDVPNAYWSRLTRIDTQEGLLSCPGVPDDILLKLDEHMFVKPIELVAEEPTLIAPGGVDDLIRYTEGKVVAFLLELDPEQRKYVNWALNAAGPTLVKGGPGTGKSTVALYRVREMIRAMRESGVASPRVLFTTYTNALVTFSRQLLDSLLGEDASCVDVRTADSLVGTILGRAGEGTSRPSASRRSAIQKKVLEDVRFLGNPLQREAQARTVERLGHAYVFEEIEVVIQGRGLKSLEDYLVAPRPGRRVPLQETHRRAIWSVAEAYDRALEAEGVSTWQQARGRAAEIAASGAAWVPEWDAVVVDKAQDLDVSAIRLLVQVCAAPNRLFLTADESQSIYAAGFGWSDVHEQLRFVGRTGILRANHRSTRQIVEAARNWLAAGLPEDLGPDPQTHAHVGPFPACRTVTDEDGEADLVARFLRGASRELRLTIGSGAVLVPDQWTGKRLADALEERGVPARYRDSRHFELDDNAVTVLPLRAAKGLEFPVVTAAGFLGSRYPQLPESDEPDAIVEAMVRERRTLFVAMTRAMRALLILSPADARSELFEGFDPDYWNVGTA